MLESPLSFFISQKLVKFRSLELFSELFNFRLYFTENRLFELGDDYDVTVKSYLDCWYLFWHVWKEETYRFTMILIRCILLFHFQVHKQVVTNPIGKTCYKKGKTNVKETGLLIYKQGWAYLNFFCKSYIERPVSMAKFGVEYEPGDHFCVLRRLTPLQLKNSNWPPK